jgi:hypothetical protein
MIKGSAQVRHTEQPLVCELVDPEDDGSEMEAHGSPLIGTQPCSPTTPQHRYQEGYAKFGDELCNHAVDLRGYQLLIILSRGCRVARGDFTPGLPRNGT